MSLIPRHNAVKNQSWLNQPAKGVVVDNNDPDKLGRIKCSIPPFILGDTESLPWCYQKASTVLGGSIGTSSFSVPNINSVVVITFERGLYSPTYNGIWKDETTTQSSLWDDDYPNVYGFTDEQETYFRVNRTQEFAEFVHTSGSFIRFTKEGDVEIHAVRDRVDTQGRDFKNTTTRNYVDIIEGFRTTNISGNETSETGGNVDHTVSGTYGLTVTGTTAIASSASLTIDGQTVTITGSTAAKLSSGGITTISGSTINLN